MATGDHGNARCAARPEPASASWSHSPEGEPGEAAAAERAAGRPAAGARSGRLRVGAGTQGRRSRLGVGPPSAARQSISPSVRPSSGRPLPARRPSAQPPADCGCQTVPSPSRPRQPIAALPRGAAGPRRAGRPGRCLRGKETPGRTLRARRARGGPAWTDGLPAGAPRTSWTPRKGGRGDCGRPAAPTQPPGRP